MRVGFNIPHIKAAALILALLSGCGGGDGTSSSASGGSAASTPTSIPTPTPSTPPVSTARTASDYHLTYSNEFNSADVSSWSTSDFWGMRNNSGDYQAQWFADPQKGAKLFHQDSI